MFLCVRLWVEVFSHKSIQPQIELKLESVQDSFSPPYQEK